MYTFLLASNNADVRVSAKGWHSSLRTVRQRSNDTTFTHLCPALDHPKRELSSLLSLAQQCLLPQPLDPIPFRMMVFSSLHIVFVFLQQAELGAAVLRLRALLVVATLDIVAKWHLGQKS